MIVARDGNWLFELSAADVEFIARIVEWYAVRASHDNQHDPARRAAELATRMRAGTAIMDPDAGEALVELDDAARRLGVSRRTIERRIRTGQLAARQVGSTRLVVMSQCTTTDGQPSSTGR